MVEYLICIIRIMVLILVIRIAGYPHRVRDDRICSISSRCYSGEPGPPPKPRILKVRSKHRGGSAVIVLIPANPPHDGEVMDRQGPRRMALSGRADDGRGVLIGLAAFMMKGDVWVEGE